MLLLEVRVTQAFVTSVQRGIEQRADLRIQFGQGLFDTPQLDQVQLRLVGTGRAGYFPQLFGVQQQLVELFELLRIQPQVRPQVTVLALHILDQVRIPGCCRHHSRPDGRRRSSSPTPCAGDCCRRVARRCGCTARGRLGALQPPQPSQQGSERHGHSGCDGLAHQRSTRQSPSAMTSAVTSRAGPPGTLDLRDIAPPPQSVAISTVVAEYTDGATPWAACLANAAANSRQPAVASGGKTRKKSGTTSQTTRAHLTR
jgi:hypothetical protein